MAIIEVGDTVRLKDSLTVPPFARGKLGVVSGFAKCGELIVHVLFAEADCATVGKVAVAKDMVDTTPGRTIQ